jgi:predicted enzyme related to lactoylglutathione lyase
MDNHRRFVWHDLMSTDLEGSKKFYGELFGWQVKKDEQGPYNLILAEGKDIGGMMKLERAGIPSHWVGYISVDNIDDTIGKITANGGKIHHPKTDIPKIGQFAVAADPQGAVFCPFQYAGARDEKPDPTAHYRFCWDELMVPDPAAAVKFYQAVIGWESESMEMPGLGTYTLVKRPGLTGMEANAGGLMKLPPGVPHPFWMTYVSVPDADKAVEKATRLGATVTTPPMDIPDVGRFATLLDPQKAPIAILAPKM